MFHFWDWSADSVTEQAYRPRRHQRDNIVSFTPEQSLTNISTAMYHVEILVSSISSSSFSPSFRRLDSPINAWRTPSGWSLRSAAKHYRLSRDTLLLFLLLYSSTPSERRRRSDLPRGMGRALYSILYTYTQEHLLTCGLLRWTSSRSIPILRPARSSAGAMPLTAITFRNAASWAFKRAERLLRHGTLQHRTVRSKIRRNKASHCD